MSELPTLLAQIGDRVLPADDSFERLARVRGRRDRRRKVSAGVLAVAIAAGGTFTVARAFHRSESPRPIGAVPSGTYIQLQDAIPAGDSSGRYSISAFTNLPEGTKVLIDVLSPKHGAYWTAGVSGGHISIDIRLGCNGKQGNVRGSSFRVGLSVAPGDLQGFGILRGHPRPFTLGTPTTPGRRPLDQPQTDGFPSWLPFQPWPVRNVLGERFEHLSGDQVTTGPLGNQIITSRQYQLPASACGHTG